MIVSFPPSSIASPVAEKESPLTYVDSVPTVEHVVAHAPDDEVLAVAAADGVVSTSPSKKSSPSRSTTTSLPAVPVSESSWSVPTIVAGLPWQVAGAADYVEPAARSAVISAAARTTSPGSVARVSRILISPLLFAARA